jgi:hypothetical protein
LLNLLGQVERSAKRSDRQVRRVHRHH